MKEAMNNKYLFIRIAQLEDELSDVNNELDIVKSALEESNNSKESEVAQIQEDCNAKISLLEENYKREIEQKDAMTRLAIENLNERYRNDMLAKEKEILRLRESNNVLSETSQKTIADITSKCDNLASSLDQKISQNLWYRQKYWGKSSEQARLLQNRNVLTRREEKELFQINGVINSCQVDTSELNTNCKRKNNAKKLRLDYNKNNPYTAKPHYISLDSYCKLSDGEHYKKRNGKVEKRIKHILVMIPAHFEEYFIEVATIRNKGEEWDSYVEDRQVIPGVPFDAETISFILTEHYCFNTTWANIAKKLDYYGVHISDSTLGNIVHRCIAYMKEMMGDVWKNELYATDYWMIDETTGLVGIKDNKDDRRHYQTKYLWGIRANKLKLSWFIYDNGSRGRKVIKPYLDKFKGYFTTDGYIVYKLYEKLCDANQIRCACLTHIRRLFVDALHENRSLMSWFINKIKKLFEIDSWCKDHGICGLERSRVRVCHSSVIMNEIKKKFKFYINSSSFRKLGKMTQAALKYINNEWTAMENVLKFGDAELSNNLCEQMMRHIKTNLKNSQNIGSEKCAGNFCFMYSLIESCHLNAISPIKYISHLLNSLAIEKDRENLRMLLPCNCGLNNG